MAEKEKVGLQIDPFGPFPGSIKVSKTIFEVTDLRNRDSPQLPHKLNTG